MREKEKTTGLLRQWQLYWSVNQKSFQCICKRKLLWSIYQCQRSAIDIYLVCLTWQFERDICENRGLDKAEYRSWKKRFPSSFQYISPKTIAEGKGLPLSPIEKEEKIFIHKICTDCDISRTCCTQKCNKSTSAIIYDSHNMFFRIN